MDVVYGRARSKLTDQIVDGMCIRQGFMAQGDFLESVLVTFGTYKRRNDGEVHVEIRDLSAKIVGAAKTNAHEIQDNSNHEFRLGIPINKGKPYELRIKTLNCRSGRSVTAKYCRKTCDTHLFIGARLIKDGELSCTFRYRSSGGDFVGKSASPVVEKMVEIPRGSFLPGLVSIVIPHYNCPALLAKCLAALTRQTYSALDVVVVDDGSERPAYPESVVRSYEPLLSLTFAAMPKNAGAPTARNEGAKMAIGEYLLFLDSDCFLYADAIRQFVEVLMENKKAAYAYGGFRWGDEVVNPKEFDLRTLRMRNYITTMSMMRSAVFPGFDQKLKRHQDWDLWLTMASAKHYGKCTGKLMFDTPKRKGISSEENIPMMDSIKIVKRKHGLK